MNIKTFWQSLKTAHDLVTLFACYIKDLFPKKYIQTGHVDLLEKTGWMWTYKKSTPPQILFKAIQSSFITAYPSKLFLRLTKNNVSKEIPNIGKYSGRRSLLAKHSAFNSQ